MIGNWLRSPRQLRLVFLAVMLLLTATLGWLGVQFVLKDRQLSEKRLDDQRETAADLVVGELKTKISEVEQNLSGILAGGQPGATTRNAVYFLLQPDAVRTWPENGLIYYPNLPDVPEVSPELFRVYDELQFIKGDQRGALDLLRDLAYSSNLQVRGAALARMAASALLVGQFQESLNIYKQLASLEGVTVEGRPAPLVARLGKLEIFKRQNDRNSHEIEAMALYRDLLSGRWRISQAVYDSLSGAVHEVLPATSNDSEIRSKTALADAVYALWTGRADEDPSGRKSANTPSGPVLLLWRASEKALVGFAATAPHLESEWLREIKTRLDERNVGIVLTDQDGSVIGVTPSTGSRATTRLAGDLPWTVQTYNTGVEGESWRTQPLLLAGMVVLVALILTGAWFIGHAVSRELAVARLQSDFVTAVSHEFRTPLTTLCQLSELLRRGRVAGEADRLQYYELLNNESQRLRRLVESLLNFGRLESGHLQFRFQDLDAAAFVRQCTEEFAKERQARGYRFEIETGADSVPVRADRDTLQCVFWNLLENAVKYSPGCETVWVDVARNNGTAEIRVRDRGAGIPRHEQRRVFEKFVRGSAARSSDVRGTGIGLAIARQIVRAHGGDISLESEPGKGSTFRVVLPVVQHSDQPL